MRGHLNPNPTTVVRPLWERITFNAQGSGLCQPGPLRKTKRLD